MPVCPRCRRQAEPGADRCAACHTPVLDVVGGPAGGRPAAGKRVVRPDPTREPSSSASGAEEPLVLLLEEPLYEMAAMIREFLQNCGIGVLVHGESIGLLYRLPAPGAPISRSKVYVRESDFQEARELVANFFARG